MSFTSWISAYAAAAATGALVVQFFTWRAAQTRLTIKAKAGTAPLSDGTGEAVFVTVVNRSDHAVKLINLFVETAGGKTFVVPYPLPATKPFPYSIPARDQLVLWADRNGITSDGEQLQIVRAGVFTATDDRFVSKRQSIDDQPRWSVATMEHS